MEIDIPNIDDVRFRTKNRSYYRDANEYKLTPVGERLIEFLQALGVPMTNPEGWKTDHD